MVPCFNGAATLARQLGGLAGQRDAPEFEVVLVDNRSTDGSRSIAESWADRLPGLRVVDAFDRPGAAYARNVGARAAEGAVLLFCDADDIVSDTWVADMVRSLEDVDLASGWLSFERLNPAHLRTGATETELPRPFDYLPTIAGSNFGIERATYLRLGGMDESFPLDEDVDFAWRCGEAGLRVAAVPAVVNYQQRTTMRAVFHQFRNYASSSILLWVRYADRPLRPIGMRGSLVQLVKEVRQVTRLLHGPRSRWELARDLGSALGAVEGNLKYRIHGDVPEARLMDIDEGEPR
ncbi:hypothetical protein ASG76_00885 [Nocardioides sp. Soil774]|uniref:glycosyltransferase n=1 Tax=Nocardioides sp. Soil774 TaxID=1736408 RepID=UPI0006F552AC|nr:glycosyltransferase [Nocardioides sp. Soil774]KRE97317.1 hypothetical protein ASG76_00885 [Nocardioides sp. Soil774]